MFLTISQSISPAPCRAPTSRCSQQTQPTQPIAYIISVGSGTQKPHPPLEKQLIKASIPPWEVDMGINYLINKGMPVSLRGSLQNQAWLPQLLLHKQLNATRPSPASYSSHNCRNSVALLFFQKEEPKQTNLHPFWGKVLHDQAAPEASGLRIFNYLLLLSVNRWEGGRGGKISICRWVKLRLARY